MSTPSSTTSEGFAHYPPIMAEAFARLAAQQEITARKVDALSESTKRMGEQLGGMANNQGAVAEEFFYSSLLEHPEIGPFRFSKIISNHLVGSRGKETEFDLVLVGAGCVVVVEIKYKLHPSHIEKLGQQIAAFKRLSPEFSAHAVYGALAGFSVPQAVIDAATAQGYMVLKRKGQAISSFTQGLVAR
jgi:hypothetical protein